MILEATARAGKAAETKQKIEELAAAHPDRITASDYRTTADQLEGAGAEGIEVLHLGDKRFPDDPSIDAAVAKEIEKSKTQQDPAALEKLRTLGYVE